jgi:hypothetical protein
MGRQPAFEFSGISVSLLFATYLGRQDQIGTIAARKKLGVVVIRGDKANRISDIENVEIAFKDGVGHDRQKPIK